MSWREAVVEGENTSLSIEMCRVDKDIELNDLLSCKEAIVEGRDAFLNV